MPPHVAGSAVIPLSTCSIRFESSYIAGLPLGPADAALIGGGTVVAGDRIDRRAARQQGMGTRAATIVGEGGKADVRHAHLIAAAQQVARVVGGEVGAEGRDIAEARETVIEAPGRPGDDGGAQAQNAAG